eukprot:SM000069S20739  [mRNA]  locus=s69:521604:527234:- [translate_table: standard]
MPYCRTTWLVLWLATAICIGISTKAAEHSQERAFKIQADGFWRNGKPVRLLSGSIHYFRIHPQYWEDRLRRVKALGLNAIQTYVPWNFHEPKKGLYNFQGMGDVMSFLHLAQKLDLLVLLRVGPYICAEWDLGGLPAWLLAISPPVSFRTADEAFLVEVPYHIENEYGHYGSDHKYIQELVTLVKYHLGNDTIIYTTDTNRYDKLHAGSLLGSAVYTAVDFAPNVDIESAFALQKLFNPPGQSPAFCSEFYVGWLASWGGQMPSMFHPWPWTTTLRTLQHLLEIGASVNLYVCALVWLQNLSSLLVANANQRWHMEAPISASGLVQTANGRLGIAATHLTSPRMTMMLLCTRLATTELNLRASIVAVNEVVSSCNSCSSHEQYSCSVAYAVPEDIFRCFFPPVAADIRALFTRHSGSPVPPAPPPPLLPRMALGRLELTEGALLLDWLDVLSMPPGGIRNSDTMTMEQAGQSSGVIVYRTTIPSWAGHGGSLSVDLVHDFASVFISLPKSNGSRLHVGYIDRTQPACLKLPAESVAGSLLDIMVEERGRVNFAVNLRVEQALVKSTRRGNLSRMRDVKGITEGVLLDNHHLFNWTMYPLPLDNLNLITFNLLAKSRQAVEPTFVRSFFELHSENELNDTFLSFPNWGKGVAFMNSFNLGRYWPAKGPQCTLFVPAPLLKVGLNELVRKPKLVIAANMVQLAGSYVFSFFIMKLSWSFDTYQVIALCVRSINTTFSVQKLQPSFEDYCKVSVAGPKTHVFTQGELHKMKSNMDVSQVIF